MNACAICGELSNYRFVFETVCVNTKEHFFIGECESCGVRKVLNVPKVLEAFYQNTHMRKKDNVVYSSLKGILLKKELQRILRFSGKNVSFWDIGCGTGDFSRIIYNNGFKVTAVDSSPQRPVCIKASPQVPYVIIDYADGRMREIEHIDGGVVIVRHVLEHLLSPDIFITTLIKSGASGFYVLAPRHGSLEEKIFKEYYSFYDPPMHLWFFSQDNLRAFFKRMKLEVVSEGLDTIPSIISNVYRFLSLHRYPDTFCSIFHPKGVISTLCAPLNLLIPHNVLWFYLRVK